MLKYSFILFIFYSTALNAHDFTGMIGFYDGLSHPVLGMDHFIAMVSVGVISVQIGGRAIFLIPFTFVIMMIFGGIFGWLGETYFLGITESIIFLIELGIILSVILLGLAIAIENKLPKNIVMVFISAFGLCHGAAHGIEMPWAANPALFALGFASGTATLHLFGVGIGALLNKSNFTNNILRLSGMVSAIYGVSLIF